MIRQALVQLAACGAMSALALCVAASAAAQPPDPSGLRAPGLRSGPRLPLDTAPGAGFGAILARTPEGTAQPLFLGLLRFYRTVVSPLNGSNSDLAPVHSLYAVEAVHRYGVLLGSVLTTERLLHESSVVPHAPRLEEGRRAFSYDPLAWNVYWLPDWLRRD